MEINKYQEMENLEKFHWWFIYRQNILKFVLKNYLSNLDKDSTILDIGCGTGGNLQLLSQFYNNVIGVEPNDLAIEYCKSKNLSNIIKSGLPNLNLVEDFSADVILLFDVLEHVDEDVQALSIVKNKLKDGGYIILTVPAFNFLWSTHDESFHHKRRYTHRQIQKMITTLDLKILKLSYLYFLLFPLVVCMRILKNFFKPLAEADDFQLNNKFLNTLITTLLLPERILLKYIDFPFGSSILAVAKKEFF